MHRCSVFGDFPGVLLRLGDRLDRSPANISFIIFLEILPPLVGKSSISSALKSGGSDAGLKLELRRLRMNGDNTLLTRDLDSRCRWRGITFLDPMELRHCRIIYSVVSSFYHFFEHHAFHLRVNIVYHDCIDCTKECI